MGGSTGDDPERIDDDENGKKDQGSLPVGAKAPERVTTNEHGGREWDPTSGLVLLNLTKESLRVDEELTHCLGARMPHRVGGTMALPCVPLISESSKAIVMKPRKASIIHDNIKRGMWHS